MWSFVLSVDGTDLIYMKPKLLAEKQSVHGGIREIGLIAISMPPVVMNTTSYCFTVRQITIPGRSLNAAQTAKQCMPLLMNYSRRERTQNFQHIRAHQSWLIALPFFQSKIDTIRAGLPLIPGELSIDIPLPSSSLTSLELASAEEIAHIIRKSPSKHSVLNPIPTWLVKEALVSLVPYHWC